MQAWEDPNSARPLGSASCSMIHVFCCGHARATPRVCGNKSRSMGIMGSDAREAQAQVTRPVFEDATEKIDGAAFAGSRVSDVRDMASGLQAEMLQHLG